jgi:hypothetical protein
MPEDPRRARIRKGVFLTSDAVPEGYTVKRRPLAPEHEHFEQAAALADELATFRERQAAAIGELARRFLAVRAQLDELKGKRPKR